MGQMMDDNSIRRVVHAVAQIQPRNYVVMEVKANIVDRDRRDLLSKWEASSGLRRVAAIMVGEPPAEIKKRGQELALKEKQEAIDAEFQKKRFEEKRKREMERQKVKADKLKKKAEKESKKKQEELKKKVEIAKKKREAQARGEEYIEEDKEPKEEEPEDED